MILLSIFSVPGIKGAIIGAVIYFLLIRPYGQRKTKEEQLRIKKENMLIGRDFLRKVHGEQWLKDNGYYDGDYKDL